MTADESIHEDAEALAEAVELMPAEQRKQLAEFNRLNNENAALIKSISSFGVSLENITLDRFGMFVDTMRTMIPADIWNDFELRWARHMNERLKELQLEVDELVRAKQTAEARSKLLGPTGRSLHRG